MDDCQKGVWNNVILNNGICKDCPSGIYGANCSAVCPSGYYGYRCEGRCNCTRKQFCHPASGCGTLLINGTFYIKNDTATVIDKHLHTAKYVQSSDNPYTNGTENTPTVCQPCECSSHSYLPLALSVSLSGLTIILILFLYAIISRKTRLCSRNEEYQEEKTQCLQMDQQNNGIEQQSGLNPSSSVYTDFHSLHLKEHCKPAYVKSVTVHPVETDYIPMQIRAAPKDSNLPVLKEENHEQGK